MLSFPIPVEGEKGVSSKDISFDGKKLHRIFQELGFSDLEIKKRFHLDPDIQSLAKNRAYGAFGQTGAALSHLKNNDIDKGDIFLFFGSFSETLLSEDNKLRYNFMHPFHSIWGYLVIDEIIDNIHHIPETIYYDLVDHPHYLNKDIPPYQNGNALFVGNDYGTFYFNDILRLTKIGYKKTYWSLPADFLGKAISYNKLPDRLTEDKRLEFKSASKGQEFIIDNVDGQLNSWLKAILNCRNKLSKSSLKKCNELY